MAGRCDTAALAEHHMPSAAVKHWRDHSAARNGGGGPCCATWGGERPEGRPPLLLFRGLSLRQACIGCHDGAWVGVAAPGDDKPGSSRTPDQRLLGGVQVEQFLVDLGKAAGALSRLGAKVRPVATFELLNDDRPNAILAAAGMSPSKSGPSGLASRPSSPRTSCRIKPPPILQFGICHHVPPQSARACHNETGPLPKSLSKTSSATQSAVV